MAKKKFFNEKVTTSNFSMKYLLIIFGFIVAIFLCFLLAKSLHKPIPDGAIIELRDKVTIKLYDDLPDKTLFFSELQNVNEKDIKASFIKVDRKHVGIYDVKLKVFNKKFKTKLEVIDNESPVLVAKNIEIKQGKKYKASNFVDKCSDNSKEKCIVEFYKDAIDQDGNKINYASYTTPGTYTIQILAHDNSENYTPPVSATLTIIENKKIDKKDTTPTKEIKKVCKYGSDQYDTTKYVLASNITEDGCAIDLNLYQDEKLTKALNSLMEKETNKLKKDFSVLNIPGAYTLNRNTQAILNKTGNGIVGYALHMELLIDGEIVASYYVKADGTRVFSVNKYNIQ